MENFFTIKYSKIIIPKDKIAPVKDIKNPMEISVPRNNPTRKTRQKSTIMASMIPISYKTIRIIILANPSFTPGMPILGINDSNMAIIIAPAVKTPKRAILCVFILNFDIINSLSFDDNIYRIISAYDGAIGFIDITHIDTILMWTI